MSKIFLRTKYDNEMKMNIPHSHNMANAMYGFRDLGAEIVPYFYLKDIYNKVTKDDIVIDYVHQCNEVLKKFNIFPNIPDYPKELEHFLGRKLWRDTINSFSSDENKWSYGYFIKPTKEKLFTGKVVKSINDLIGCGHYDDNYEIIVSEPLDILAEWRCFILYDEIIDVRSYGSWIDSTKKSYLYHYDSNVLEAMINAFSVWKDRPMACSMDICFTKEGKTLLVELNDAYALASYGLQNIQYAKLISARWSQLLGVSDPYRFY